MRGQAQPVWRISETLMPTQELSERPSSQPLYHPDHAFQPHARMQVLKEDLVSLNQEAHLKARGLQSKVAGRDHLRDTDVKDSDSPLSPMRVTGPAFGSTNERGTCWEKSDMPPGR